MVKCRRIISEAILLIYTYLFLILVGVVPVRAQVIPTDLTEKQQTKVDQFVLNYIRNMRVEELQPQPALVKKFNKEYHEHCLQRAGAEIKKHRKWFYCEGKKGYCDAVVTYRVYWQLIHYYGGLENIPGYSPENHRKAITFWQSWQQEDGSFKNPVFPGKSINQKYIPPPNIMGLLGCKPLFKTSGYGKEDVNVGYFLNQCDSCHLNNAMARAAVMLTRIHEGETEYIPILERGIELALAHMSPFTGMFQGVNGNPSGDIWSGYGTTMETMKGLSRMIGYMGVENMPNRHLRADILIKNQEYFRKGHVAVMRNTAEMYMQCLFESSFRQEELLQAMEGNADALLSAAKWKTSHEESGGDYTAFALTIFGSYLHWEGYEREAPRTLFYQGIAHDWRVVIGPYGNCVNVIRKKPQEMLWDKDWSYKKYGLRTRNAVHELREVVDIVPASGKGWQQSKDEEGRIVMTSNFPPVDTKLDNPYLKIKWDGGAIEIFINGIFVRKKLGSLVDYGGVWITPEAGKSLRAGENTIVVRTVSGAQEGTLNVSAGIIDWRLPLGCPGE